MIHIAVCDDDIAICSQIEKIIQKHSTENEISTFYTGEKLIADILDRQYFDLIFLDIEMDRLNGIDVGRKIRNEMNNNTIQIVYISSKENYAMSLFKIRPFDFLVKPIKETEVVKIIDNVCKLFKNKNKFFEFQIDGVYRKIPIKNILYFESKLRRIKIVTVSDEYFIYDKLCKIQDEIKDFDFVIIHKSYFVNFSLVKKYSYEQLTMINNDILPISQPNRKIIRSYFLERRSKCYD